VELRELTEKWHGYNGGQILIDACIHGNTPPGPSCGRRWPDMPKTRAGMHVHVSETRAEHEECLGRYA
jgi:5-methylthioadenosine/S-adenosylhomocysteine deaminase